VTGFTNKEHNQVTTSIGLSTDRIYILIWHISSFNEEEAWFIEKHLFDLVLIDVMLDCQFFQNITQPQETVNVHERSSCHWLL